jgi:hypothetical protein
LQRQELPVGLDIVTIPRADDPPALVDMQASLLRLVRQAAKRIARDARQGPA